MSRKSKCDFEPYHDKIVEYAAKKLTANEILDKLLDIPDVDERLYDASDDMVKYYMKTNGINRLGRRGYKCNECNDCEECTRYTSIVGITHRACMRSNKVILDNVKHCPIWCEKEYVDGIK